jgi:hypothetical protein
MKTAVAVLACAAGACAFAPAAKSSKVAVALNSVFDDYVGGVDLRGQKFEFDPVRIGVSLLGMAGGMVSTLSSVVEL